MIDEDVNVMAFVWGSLICAAIGTVGAILTALLDVRWRKKQ